MKRKFAWSTHSFLRRCLSASADCGRSKGRHQCLQSTHKCRQQAPVTLVFYVTAPQTCRPLFPGAAAPMTACSKNVRGLKKPVGGMAIGHLVFVPKGGRACVHSRAGCYAQQQVDAISWAVGRLCKVPSLLCNRLVLAPFRTHVSGAFLLTTALLFFLPCDLPYLSSRFVCLFAFLRILE